MFAASKLLSTNDEHFDDADIESIRRIETNFHRLLRRCYQQATSSGGIPSSIKSKFPAYLQHLDKSLNALEDVHENKRDWLKYKDDLEDARRKLAFLHKLDHRGVQRDEMCQGTTHSNAPRQEEQKSRLQSRAQFIKDLRAELFEKPEEKHLSSEDESHRSEEELPKDEERIENLYKEEESHLNIRAQMLKGTEMLRDNVMKINENLQKDAGVLDEAHASGESNISGLQHASNRLKDFVAFSSSEVCSSYLQMAFVVAVFLFMVFFIRIVPKPRH